MHKICDSGLEDTKKEANRLFFVSLFSFFKYAREYTEK